jgi:hypothetical protein
VECGIVFFILIFVIIVAVAFATNAQQRTALNDAYTKLANRFQGSIETAGTFSGYPSVRFMHNAAHVLVDVHSTGGEDATYYTQFHISWPDRNLRCEIYPERFMSRVGKLMGMQDIQIGSPQFDPNYIITGNDEGAIRELLTPTVQAHVDRLRRMFDRDDIYLSIGGGILLVKKRNILRSYSDLMQFTSASLELFEQALGSRASNSSKASAIRRWMKSSAKSAARTSNRTRSTAAVAARRTITTAGNTMAPARHTDVERRNLS